jgi:hypothetical protein
MNQIIKTKIDFFNEFIISIGTVENNYVMIDETIFKKAEYNNLIRPFIDKLVPHYHKSKQFYLTREINFSNFITVIRQICKSNDIEYTSKLKYSKSSHYIEYYFYVLI